MHHNILSRRSLFSLLWDQHNTSPNLQLLLAFHPYHWLHVSLARMNWWLARQPNTPQPQTTSFASITTTTTYQHNSMRLDDNDKSPYNKIDMAKVVKTMKQFVGQYSQPICADQTAWWEAIEVLLINVHAWYSSIIGVFAWRRWKSIHVEKREGESHLAKG